MDNVTIQDAINAFSLLKEHVNENGFLDECYNLGISALKTIQDGNYQLQPHTVSRETLKLIATFECKGLSCNECKYNLGNREYYHACMVLKAQAILRHEQDVKEMEKWIQENS